MSFRLGSLSYIGRIFVKATALKLTKFSTGFRFFYSFLLFILMYKNTNKINNKTIKENKVDRASKYDEDKQTISSWFSIIISSICGVEKSIEDTTYSDLESLMGFLSLSGLRA